MEMIFSWIRSLVFYMILMMMVLNLLPNKKYEKYLRLFTGMVLILVVFEPFTDLAGIETAMAGAFSRITFENDVRILKGELSDADNARLKRLFAGYEEMVEGDLKMMAEGSGLICLEADAVLSRADSDAVGSLESVTMTVVPVSTTAQSAGTSFEDSSKEPPDADSLTQVHQAFGGEGAAREARLEINRTIAGLKKRIGEYYGLEEGKITIHLETE